MSLGYLRGLENVCKKPLMYVQAAQYSAVCSYIHGFDSALCGGVLDGFREWLLTGGEEWTNMPWWAIVRLRVDREADLNVPPTPEQDPRLLAELAAVLEQFATAKDKQGRSGIYYAYHKWILEKSPPGAEWLQDCLAVERR